MKLNQPTIQRALALVIVPCLLTSLSAGDLNVWITGQNSSGVYIKGEQVNLTAHATCTNPAVNLTGLTYQWTGVSPSSSTSAARLDTTTQGESLEARVVVTSQQGYTGTSSVTYLVGDITGISPSQLVKVASGANETILFTVAYTPDLEIFYNTTLWDCSPTLNPSSPLGGSCSFTFTVGGKLYTVRARNTGAEKTSQVAVIRVFSFKLDSTTIDIGGSLSGTAVPEPNVGWPDNWPTYSVKPTADVETLDGKTTSTCTLTITTNAPENRVYTVTAKCGNSEKSDQARVRKPKSK